MACTTSQVLNDGYGGLTTVQHAIACPSHGTTLAYTGFDILWVVVIAAVLIGLGVLARKLVKKV